MKPSERLISGLAALSLFFAVGPQAKEAPDDAPEVPAIDRTAITVSGISSGGAMAQQLHLAYADLFSGAGIIAGVPWGCAEGELGLALGRCTGKEDGPLPVARFVDAYRAAAEAGQVADPGLLADDRVWLMHGALDDTVPEKVVVAAAAVYEQVGRLASRTLVTDIPAAHLFPTLDTGVACDSPEAPWLGACNFDAAGALLTSLHPGLEPPTAVQRQADPGDGLHPVQLPGASDAGLAETAWLFVPPSCPENGCRMHLALHGCLMAADGEKKPFVEDAGYLPWARANGIVVAFPQVASQPLNPLGCWDWWGYTGPDYLTRDGAQPRILAAWVRSLLDG